MEMIRNGLDLVLKVGEKTILECSNSFPMIYVGYGKEDFCATFKVVRDY